MSDNRQAFQPGLCDQHPVERVRVVCGQRGSGSRMIEVDEELGEVAVHAGLLERPWDSKRPGATR